MKPVIDIPITDAKRGNRGVLKRKDVGDPARAQIAATMLPTGKAGNMFTRAGFRNLRGHGSINSRRVGLRDNRTAGGRMGVAVNMSGVRVSTWRGLHRSRRPGLSLPRGPLKPLVSTWTTNRPNREGRHAERTRKRYPGSTERKGPCRASTNAARLRIPCPGPVGFGADPCYVGVQDRRGRRAESAWPRYAEPPAETVFRDCGGFFLQSCFPALGTARGGLVSGNAHSNSVRGARGDSPSYAAQCGHVYPEDMLRDERSQAPPGVSPAWSAFAPSIQCQLLREAFRQLTYRAGTNHTPRGPPRMHPQSE